MNKAILVCLLFAVTLIPASCGGSRHLTAVTPHDSGTSTVNAVQPQWLTDALAELDDKRKANLLAIVKDFPQAVITSASNREIKGLLPLNPHLFAVADGTVRPVKAKTE